MYVTPIIYNNNNNNTQKTTAIYYYILQSFFNSFVFKLYLIKATWLKIKIMFKTLVKQMTYLLVTNADNGNKGTVQAKKTMHPMNDYILEKINKNIDVDI